METTGRVEGLGPRLAWGLIGLRDFVGVLGCRVQSLGIVVIVFSSCLGLG